MVFFYVTQNEIAVHDYIDATNIMSTLIKNDYVVMLSREEDLYIINYIYSPHGADRNDVCFQDRDLVEEFIFDTDAPEEKFTFEMEEPKNEKLK